MCIGMVLYLILCGCEWFRSMLSYTDAEYQLMELYLHPEVKFIILLAANTIEFAFMLIVPFLIFVFLSILKKYIIKAYRYIYR